MSAVDMENRWPVVSLSEVAEQCLGKMLDAKKNKGTPLKYLRNPNVKWFEIDLSDLREMPFEDHELDRYGLEQGDVLICEGGEAGRAAIWDAPMANVKFQKAIHRVRCGPRLHNRFLVHRLMADYQSGQLADYYTGVTINHLTGRDLARYRFALPPVEEQQRIATILDQAESLRAKRRAALEQLDVLAQATFIEMFGDPVRNPKGINKLPLKDICAIGTGSTPSRQVVGNYEGDTCWVKTTEVRGGVVHDTEEKISEQGLKSSRCKIFPVGSILVALYGQGKTRGQCAVLGTEAATNQACGVLLPSESYSTDFLFEQLKFSYERLRAMGRGGNQENLNLGLLGDFEVLVPNLAQQAQFTEKVQTVQLMKNRFETGLAHLNVLFSSLQHRAFRGEL